MHGALKAGARGFLLKDAGPELLVQAIQAAADGDALIAPSVTARLLAAFADAGLGRRRPSRSSRSPAREEEVLLTVARGPHQRRDRRRAAHQPQHREDPPRQPDGQARARNRVEIAMWAYETGRMERSERDASGS